MQNSYYLFSNGELTRKDNTLRLCYEDGSYVDVPIEKVYDIYVFGQITINSSLLAILSKYSIILHFFNYYEFYIGSFYPKEQLVSGKLLISQVEHYTDLEKRILLAKKFVIGASDNIQRNLKYYANRDRDLNNTISKINDYVSVINDVSDIPTLMGIEGNIRKEYYTKWQDIFTENVEFEKRIKRPPDNMVNTLISFLNSCIYTKVLSEIYKTQINPTISYLHEPSERRFSLSLDISEIFKPLIVDRLIFTLINKKMITENEFVRESNCLRMKENTIKLLVKELDNRLKTTIKHRTLKKDVSYRYLIRIEIYKLIKHLLNEKEYDPFKIWW